MNLYFSGIGNIQLAPLAEIALDAGYNVTGSDKYSSALSHRLTSRGVDIEIGSQDGSFLEKSHKDQLLDYFVHEITYPIDHPEIVKAKELGIKIATKDQLVSQITKEKNLRLIAVAGSHGKTTVTGMLIWAFESLNIPASYYINATMNFGPSGAFSSGSEYFIYESDEYDKSFLSLEPYLAVVTNIDYNHPETYATISSYVAAYKDFVARSKKVIGWNNQRSEIYKNHHDALLIDSKDIDTNIKLAGKYNRQNAFLVESALKLIGINGSVSEVLNKYPGLGRRFEKIVENLYIDCAYHPIEVAAALDTAKEHNERVVLVYQPYSNGLQKALKDRYTDQLDIAEKIYWLPTEYSQHEKHERLVTSEELTRKLSNKEKLQFAELNDELWYNIEQDRLNGMLVLCIGVSIEGWLRGRLS